MRRVPIISLMAIVLASGASSVGARDGPLPDPVVFTGTGVPAELIVPTSATQMSIELVGAAGGDGSDGAEGGSGGVVRLDVAVRPGSVVTVAVGLPGSSGGGISFGGGAAAGDATDGRVAGSGGGATRVWVDGAIVAVAGGGGGAGGAGAVWTAGPDGSFDATPPQTPVAGGAGGDAGRPGAAGSDTPTAFASHGGAGGTDSAGGAGGAADMPIQHTSSGTPGAAGLAPDGATGGAGADGAGPGGGGGGGVPGGGGGGAGGRASAGLDAVRYIGGGGGGGGGGNWPQDAAHGTSTGPAQAVVRFSRTLSADTSDIPSLPASGGTLPGTGSSSTLLRLGSVVAALGVCLVGWGALDRAAQRRVKRSPIGE